MNKKSLPPNAIDHLNTSRQVRIDQERTFIVYKQSCIGLTASIIIAAITVVVLRKSFPTLLLAGWFAAILIVSMFRLVLVRKYPHKNSTMLKLQAWSRWNNITLLLSGMVWGTASWLLFPLESVVHQFFLMIALCGMVAGAAMAFAIIESAFFCYSIPALFPLILRLITIGDESHLAMGCMALLYWGLSYMIVVNYKRARIKLLNLKEDLSDQVAERTLNLENLNDRLRAENRHRLRMEERLRQERDRLEIITGNLGAGIAVISSDYKVLWTNQVLKAIMGDIEGQSCFHTLYKNIHRSECNAVKVLEEGYEKMIREQESRDSQAKPVWFQIITTPIRDHEDRITAALELVLPVTEMKKVQEEKQRIAAQLEEARKLEAIATLAGGMAHKFNNALAVIMGNAELMRFELDDEVQKERFLKPIVSAASHMSQMTDQLLAYAKGGKYKAKPTDICTFIEDTTALLKHTLPPEINLTTTLEKPLPHVKMDLTQMQMAFSAILSNAAEALLQHGNIHIHGRNYTAPSQNNPHIGKLPPGTYVAITVEDDGVGMNEKTLKRIFEPFFSTKLEGRGLGMAAVYGIVQNHGGHVTVTSQPKKGTQVTVFLPATTAPGKTVGSGIPINMKGHGAVLLIEDEDLVRQINESILLRLGYSVMTAANGKEATQKIRNPNIPIDVILLDIKLPDMDGLTIYPIAKTHRPKAKIIVCSGYALDGPTRTLMDAGADGFIQKPFSVEHLAKKLNDVLRQEHGSGSKWTSKQHPTG